MRGSSLLASRRSDTQTSPDRMSAVRVSDVGQTGGYIEPLSDHLSDSPTYVRQRGRICLTFHGVEGRNRLGNKYPNLLPRTARHRPPVPEPPADASPAPGTHTPAPLARRARREFHKPGDASGSSSRTELRSSRHPRVTAVFVSPPNRAGDPSTTTDSCGIGHRPYPPTSPSR